MTIIKILIAQSTELSINYSNAMISLGVNPYSILSIEDISSFSGLILTGGGDIHPQFLKSTSSKLHLVQVDAILDSAQFKLLSQFIQAGKPVLGICKGMQLINVHFGGTLIQHLPTASRHAYNQKDQTHKTSNLIFPTNSLFTLYGSTMITNSAHHQGVGILGKDLLLTQHTKDHVIEGILHKTLPIMGVQWHPERMCFDHKRKDTSDGSLLLSHFLNICKES